MYQKSIIPNFVKIGKRKKMNGVIGELSDGHTILHSKEYGSYSEAEVALDALMFDLLSAAPAEAPAEAASTCCFCHRPHHPQHCGEMRAMLFAPPLDVDFAPVGFEVA